MALICVSLKAHFPQGLVETYRKKIATQNILVSSNKLESFEGQFQCFPKSPPLLQRKVYFHFINFRVSVSWTFCMIVAFLTCCPQSITSILLPFNFVTFQIERPVF